MTESFDRPSKRNWLLLKFTNARTGDLIAAYTNRDSADTFEGVDYESVTAMEVALPDNSGILKADPCNVVMPLMPGFATDISSGARYPETKLSVVEVTKSDNASTSYTRPFQGIIVGAKRNIKGRGFVGLSALPVKSRLQSASMGLQCMHHCINRLGDAQCGVALDTPPKRITSAEIVAIDGTKVTIATGQVQTGLIDRFYQRGYIVKDGLEIMIQTWRNESNGDRHEFFLMRRPPSFWLNANVSIFVGCDKTIETCRAKFNNESHFNGIGIGMPAYHPVYEQGSGQ